MNLCICIIIQIIIQFKHLILKKKLNVYQIIDLKFIDLKLYIFFSLC